MCGHGELGVECTASGMVLARLVDSVQSRWHCGPAWLARCLAKWVGCDGGCCPGVARLLWRSAVQVLMVWCGGSSACVVFDGVSESVCVAYRPLLV
jgi:hypothetical protein